MLNKLISFLFHILFGEGGETMLAMLWAIQIINGKKTIVR